MRTKRKGYLLIQAILALAAFTMMSYGLVIAFSSAFNMLGANKVALEAQQYAEITADNIKLLAYENAASAAHGKSNISYAPGWQDEVIIGSESAIAGSDAKMRLATVNIYKTGDTTARYTLNVPLTSQGSGGSSDSTGSGSSTNKLDGLVPDYGHHEAITTTAATFTVPYDGYIHVDRGYLHISVGRGSEDYTTASGYTVNGVPLCPAWGVPEVIAKSIINTPGCYVNFLDYFSFNLGDQNTQIILDTYVKKGDIIQNYSGTYSSYSSGPCIIHLYPLR